MRYLIYARKSSESEEKQAQSIEDQLKELRLLATQRQLTVVGEFTEARSAKDPGGRPVFAEVVARIQASEADGILCWHVNRLFRNPVDFGTIAWMLQSGRLKEIYTPHQIHRTSDNVLLLSVENGMANQYIIDLKKAVERGLNSKVEKGWYPHKAPEGYLNRDGEIERDTARFALIRQVWDMALSGKTTMQIMEQLRQWNYLTKRYKRTGGTLPSRATLYNILSNIFYAGYFVRSGQTFKGAHDPMITLQEFFQVQKQFKQNTRRHRTHNFAFSGLIRCGECGCAVVGERKTKKLATGGVREYVYYSCSNARRTCKRRVTTEAEIERQILTLLDKIFVPESFLALAQEGVSYWKTQENVAREEEHAQIARTLTELEHKQDKLLDFRMNELLTDEEYLVQKAKLHEALLQARIEQQRLHERTDAQWENFENLMALLHFGRTFFEGGEPAIQHLIADAIGAQYILTNRRLAVELKPVFGKVAELKNETDFGSDKTKRDLPQAERLVWWNTLDFIRTTLLTSDQKIPLLQLDGCPLPRNLF